MILEVMVDSLVVYGQCLLDILSVGLYSVIGKWDIGWLTDGWLLRCIPYRWSDGCSLVVGWVLEAWLLAGLISGSLFGWLVGWLDSFGWQFSASLSLIRFILIASLVRESGQWYWWKFPWWSAEGGIVKSRSESSR